MIVITATNDTNYCIEVKSVNITQEGIILTDFNVEVYIKHSDISKFISFEIVEEMNGLTPLTLSSFKEDYDRYINN